MPARVHATSDLTQSRQIGVRSRLLHYGTTDTEGDGGNTDAERLVLLRYSMPSVAR